MTQERFHDGPGRALAGVILRRGEAGTDGGHRDGRVGRKGTGGRRHEEGRIVAQGRETGIGDFVIKVGGKRAVERRFGIGDLELGRHEEEPRMGGAGVRALGGAELSEEGDHLRELRLLSQAE